MYHKAFLAALLLLAAPSITSPVLEARGGGIMITPNGPVDTRAGNGPAPANQGSSSNNDVAAQQAQAAQDAVQDGTVESDFTPDQQASASSVVQQEKLAMASTTTPPQSTPCMTYTTTGATVTASCAVEGFHWAAQHH